jgi:hypothetical protein
LPHSGLVALTEHWSFRRACEGGMAAVSPDAWSVLYRNGIVGLRAPHRNHTAIPTPHTPTTSLPGAPSEFSYPKSPAALQRSYRLPWLLCRPYELLCAPRGTGRRPAGSKETGRIYSPGSFLCRPLQSDHAFGRPSARSISRAIVDDCGSRSYSPSGE